MYIDINNREVTISNNNHYNGYQKYKTLNDILIYCKGAPRIFDYSHQLKTSYVDNINVDQSNHKLFNVIILFSMSTWSIVCPI